MATGGVSFWGKSGTTWWKEVHQQQAHLVAPQAEHCPSPTNHLRTYGGSLATVLLPTVSCPAKETLTQLVLGY